MKARRILAVVLAVVMLVGMAAGLAACRRDEAEGLQIVIVTSGSSVDDGSFNQDNWMGIQDFLATNQDATAQDVLSLNIADAMSDVDAVLADFDVIVLPGFQFSGVSSRAAANPDTYFILVDSDPQEYNGQTNFPNVYAMTFKEHESGFLAGIAAALETTTGYVAFVGGMAFPPVVNYQFGFEAGVTYANANLGADATLVEIAAFGANDVTGTPVGGNYVGDFGDPATGKLVGDALIDLGVDIIFVAAGGSGMGVFTSAMENPGVFVIGCDVDQFDDGVFAGGNVVLTSVLKNMRVNVTRVLNAIETGTFAGGNFLLGADTGSTGVVTTPGRHQMSAGTVAHLERAFEQLSAGTIVPPSNFNPGNLPRR